MQDDFDTAGDKPLETAGTLVDPVALRARRCLEQATARLYGFLDDPERVGRHNESVDAIITEYQPLAVTGFKFDRLKIQPDAEKKLRKRPLSIGFSDQVLFAGIHNWQEIVFNPVMFTLFSDETNEQVILHEYEHQLIRLQGGAYQQNDRAVNHAIELVCDRTADSITPKVPYENVLKNLEIWHMHHKSNGQDNIEVSIARAAEGFAKNGHDLFQGSEKHPATLVRCAASNHYIRQLLGDFAEEARAISDPFTTITPEVCAAVNQYRVPPAAGPEARLP